MDDKPLLAQIISSSISGDTKAILANALCRLTSMACTRGKASPDRHTRQRLFAASAGYCQRPKCRRPLFVDTGTQNVHIAEMAHIFAANNTGPRPNLALTPEQRGAFENLILLCSSCHTEIDKAPTDFPDAEVARWKEEHAAKLASLFGAAEYGSRAEVRTAIEPALLENRVIFQDYGPNNEYRLNPESEMAVTWKRKMLSTIIPNNRKIILVLDANRRHLLSAELQTLEIFRQHVDDLEDRHIGEGVRGIGRRFPEEMNTIAT